MGGINEKEVLAKETPQIISRHVEEAVRDAGKKGLILGPGCVADPKTPATNYYAARLSAERF
jgi:uroporphyrinogen decarboxylase